jgi:hypothetical protein
MKTCSNRSAFINSQALQATAVVTEAGTLMPPAEECASRTPTHEWFSDISRCYEVGGDAYTCLTSADDKLGGIWENNSCTTRTETACNSVSTTKYYVSAKKCLDKNVTSSFTLENGALHFSKYQVNPEGWRTTLNLSNTNTTDKTTLHIQIEDDASLVYSYDYDINKSNSSFLKLYDYSNSVYIGKGVVGASSETNTNKSLRSGSITITSEDVDISFISAEATVANGDLFEDSSSCVEGEYFDETSHSCESLYTTQSSSSVVAPPPPQNTSSQSSVAGCDEGYYLDPVTQECYLQTSTTTTSSSSGSSSSAPLSCDEGYYFDTKTNSCKSQADILIQTAKEECESNTENRWIDDAPEPCITLAELTCNETNNGEVWIAPTCYSASEYCELNTSKKWYHDSCITLKKYQEEISTVISDINYTIAGHFIYNFEEAQSENNHWIYVKVDGTVAGKLLGLNEETGYLDYSIIQNRTNTLYDIEIKDNAITFNPLDEDITSPFISYTTPYDIKGYFINYDDSDAYAWIYVHPSKSFILKIEPDEKAADGFGWTHLEELLNKSIGSKVLFKRVEN